SGYIRDLLGTEYMVYDLLLAPADFGQTAMARPRLFTVAYRKDKVHVVTSPEHVLQEICRVVHANIDKHLSIADYCSFTPVDVLLKEENRLRARMKLPAVTHVSDDWSPVLSTFEARTALSLAISYT
ncbi:unnamed protein product, partial [Effrenium voratum]